MWTRDLKPGSSTRCRRIQTSRQSASRAPSPGPQSACRANTAEYSANSSLIHTRARRVPTRDHLLAEPATPITRMDGPRRARIQLKDRLLRISMLTTLWSRQVALGVVDGARPLCNSDKCLEDVREVRVVELLEDFHTSARVT